MTPMVTTVDCGPVFKVLNPGSGRVVQAVTCSVAAQTLPRSPRAIQRAVQAAVLPGGQTAGRWWIEWTAVKRVARDGWPIKPGPKVGQKPPRKKR